MHNSKQSRKPANGNNNKSQETEMETVITEDGGQKRPAQHSIIRPRPVRERPVKRPISGAYARPTADLEVR